MYLGLELFYKLTGQAKTQEQTATRLTSEWFTCDIDTENIIDFIWRLS